MQFGKKITMAIAAVSLLAVSASQSFASDIDSKVTTFFVKSEINGTITGVDKKGAYEFEYSGPIKSFNTDPNTGALTGTVNEVGTINGVAAFPPEFAELAVKFKAAMLGLAPMPAIPPVVDWHCNECTMVLDGSTFHPIEAAYPGVDMFTKMEMEGRAFTGLGPVEMPDANHLSVRMAGCAAVASGSDGNQANKVGTLCMNSTAIFDLSGVNFNADGSVYFTAPITAEGRSNCAIVLHTPIAM